jgi:pimeloyl-ACP methyl ester carboxylesterase
VVICHGSKGFKDWGFFPHFGRELAAALGCPTVTFNFTGSGVGPDLADFTEPEAFGHNTFGKEIDDLAAVLDGLEAGRLGSLEFAPVTRVGVVGHSRGAVAAILAGERDSVRAVATWAGIGAAERYLAPFELLAPGEVARISNARTGDVLPLYDDVAREILADPARFDLPASLGRSRVPLLVVHGTDDAAVPTEDAHRLAAVDTARLELIEGAGHTFEVGHPFEGPSPELERAIALAAEHFRTHL